MLVPAVTLVYPAVMEAFLFLSTGVVLFLVLVRLMPHDEGF